MAFSYFDYPSVGVGDTLPVPPHLKRADIAVLVDGEAVSAALYEWTSVNEITTLAGYPSGANTRVERTTAVNKYDYEQNGSSSLDWEGMNLNFTQALFVIQEYVDKEQTRNDTVEFVVGLAEALELSLEDLADAVLPMLDLKAPLESPAFTGTPTVPTPALNAPDPIVANMEAVRAAIATVTKSSLGLGSVDNVSAANLRARSTHTGEQAMSTVTGLVSALGDKASHAEVASAVASVVDSSPAALDTLKELATALGNDPNFATSTATSLGNRLRVDAPQSLTTGQKNQGAANLGVAPGATANDTDSNLKARANHTGTQTASTISDLTEVTQDMIASFLEAGTNITLTYNDAGNKLTIAATSSVDTAASSVSVSASGGISSTNAQAALAELDSEKVAKAGDIMTGDLVISKTVPQIYLNAAADNGASIWGRKGTSARWQLVLGDGGSESGGNAGSTFGVNRYTDAGAFIGRAMTLYRDSGLAQFAGDLQVNGTRPVARRDGDTFTGNITISKTWAGLVLDRPAAGTGAELVGRTNGLNRWIVALASADGEAGGNAGSDFAIRRYNDAGQYLSDAVRIERATGDVTVPHVLRLARPARINNQQHEFYAAEYGMAPGSTATANSNALTAAVAAAQAAGGGRVVLPRGFSGLSSVPGDRVSIPKVAGVEVEIVGQGKSSGLGIPNTGTAYAIYVGSGTGGGSCGITFKGMAFKGPSATQGRAILAENANLLRMEDVQFYTMQIFVDSALGFGVEFFRCLSDHVGTYAFLSSTKAHGFRMSMSSLYNTGVAGTGTAIRLETTDMTDNVVLHGNHFEFCRQVFYSLGGVSATQINGNYIEYHTVDPLGFGAGANSYGVEVKANWIALGSQLRLDKIQTGEVKWNRFHDNNIAGLTVGTEGGAAKNYLTGTSVWS